jgi:hypothetical protein
MKLATAIIVNIKKIGNLPKKNLRIFLVWLKSELKPLEKQFFQIIKAR